MSDLALNYLDHTKNEVENLIIDVANDTIQNQGIIISNQVKLGEMIHDLYLAMGIMVLITLFFAYIVIAMNEKKNIEVREAEAEIESGDCYKELK
jgi:hypothetical protein